MHSAVNHRHDSIAKLGELRIIISELAMKSYLLVNESLDEVSLVMARQIEV